MDALSAALPQLVLAAVLLLVALNLRKPPSSFWRQLRGQLDQLGNELDRHFDRERWVQRRPVYSARALRGKNGGLVRDRLLRRGPRARFVLLLLVVGALLWALTR
jgi:hypothetical protein